MKISLGLLTIACAGALCAQSANPLSADTKLLYDSVKNNVVKAAEKMPDESYGFKPVDSVRSFGQLIGHVADANYMFCSAVKGEKAPVSGIEKSKTSKADLVKSIQDSVAYCDAIYAGMTDSVGMEKVNFFRRDRTKVSILSFNTSHTNEHYGNIVTYMRIKGIVPPSSEGR